MELDKYGFYRPGLHTLIGRFQRKSLKVTKRCQKVVKRKSKNLESGTVRRAAL